MNALINLLAQVIHASGEGLVFEMVHQVHDH